MLNISLQVTDPAKIAQIMAIMMGPDGVADAPQPPQLKERKPREKKEPEVQAAATPEVVTPEVVTPEADIVGEAAEKKETPAEIRARVTPKLVAFLNGGGSDARKKVEDALKKFGAEKFGKLSDDNLLAFEKEVLG